jgi:uroporphyrinogen decarboxylase
MKQREIIKLVLDGGQPPYVPWCCWFTQEARTKLEQHFGAGRFDDALQNHWIGVGYGLDDFQDIGDHCVRDVFGVVWDRSVDQDIGNVKSCLLPEPTLAGYQFPDPHDPRLFAGIPERIAQHPELFRVFRIDLSLYERAWTLRGMENLMMDFIDQPEFAEALLNAITDYNCAQVARALEYDIDAVYFGDDWGQQAGLQMGYRTWKRFIYPCLQRMYGQVRAAGKYVFIHSCGDVHELFDDLIELGLNCFNPFQPEVMDVAALHARYGKRLTFHGGLSTQRTLPFGTPEDVRNETRRLLRMGQTGGYVFAPAHAVEGDVPLENMLAFIEEIQAQSGFRARVPAS